MALPSLTPRKRLLFAAVPVMALLGSLEVALRFGPHQNWLAGDDLWRQAYLRRRESAPPPAPSQDTPDAADIDEHDPQLGWRPRALVRSPRLNTNMRGLRGRDEHPQRPPPWHPPYRGDWRLVHFRGGRWR